MDLKAMLLVVAAAVLTLAPTPPTVAAGDAPRAQNPSTDATDATPKWERFTYPGEEFSVELPKTPSVFHTTRYVRDSLGDFEAMRVFGVYADGVVFMIVSYDRPRDKETFNDFVKYVWGGDLGDLAPKGNVTLDGFAGQEYAHSEGLGAARVFRAKNNAYLVKAHARAKNDPQVVRFLDSFSFETKNSGSAADEFKAEEARVVRAGESAPGPVVDGGQLVGPGPGGHPRVKNAGRGGPPVDYRRVFKPNEVTRKASIVYKPEPVYTEEARRNNVTGTVRMRVVFDVTGKVRTISIIRKLPDGLTEAAVKAARRMLFLPALMDGREVSQWAVIEYKFRIY